MAGRQDEGYFPSDLEPYDPQNPVVKVILDGFYHALRLPNTKREEVRLKNISSKHQTSGPMYDWMSRDCKPQLNHIKSPFKGEYVFFTLSKHQTVANPRFQQIFLRVFVWFCHGVLKAKRFRIP